MSNQALNWAREQGGFSRTAKLLLLVLADRAYNATHTAIASQAELAEAVLVKPRQLRNLIAELERVGLVQRKRRGNDRGGRDFDAYLLAVNGRFPVLSGDHQQPEESGNALPQTQSGNGLPLTPGKRQSIATYPRADDGGKAAISLQVSGNLAAGKRQRIAASSIEEPINPIEPIAAAAGRASEPLVLADPNVEPAQVVVLAAAPRASETIRAWFDRLVEAAGPGLSDPDKEPGLRQTAGELDRWARAGVDLEADAVPVIADITRRPGVVTSPVRTWKYFTAAVLRAAAERQAELTLPTIDRTETRHAQRAYDPRSPRQRADDARRKGMLAALFDADESWPGSDSCGADDPDPGAIRLVGVSRAV